MTADWDASAFYIYGVGAVSGVLYTWALMSYLGLIHRRTGASFPMLRSGVTWYVRRPWLLLRGVQRMREALYPQADPDLEAARRSFLERRTWIFLGVAAAVIVLTLLTFRQPG
jgi:hypothetical protein